MMKPIVEAILLILLVFSNMLGCQPENAEYILLSEETLALPNTSSEVQEQPDAPEIIPCPTAEASITSFDTIPEPTQTHYTLPEASVEEPRNEQATSPTYDWIPDSSESKPIETGQAIAVPGNTEPPIYYEIESTEVPSVIQVLETQTEPTEHTHNWQTTNYPETGHNVDYYCCACGYILASPGDYDAHVAAYAGTAEMFTVHGHWGTSSQWVVDVPAYTEWYCTGCGAVSSSHP